MKQSMIRIRNGSLVSAFGVREADLWIQSGIIVRISCELPEVIYPRYMSPIETFDASDYYILPGFISFTRLHSQQFSHVKHYANELQQILQRGVTTIIDSIQIESWMNRKQWAYQQTLHINSTIDYACKYSLSAAQFTPRTLRMLAEDGIKLVELVVHRAEQLDELEWGMLSWVFQAYRLSVELRLEGKEANRSDNRRAIIDRWITVTSREKIRTILPGVNPFGKHPLDPYYQISKLEAHQCQASVAYLMEHWFHNLSVMCEVDQIALSKQRQTWYPEDVLSLIVRLASVNPAKAAGCYPRKGTLLGGSDADLVFLHKDEWLTNFDLSTMLKFNEMCTFDRVMSRGKWVYRNNEHLSTPGSGSLIRPIHPYNYVL